MAAPRMDGSSETVDGNDRRGRVLEAVSRTLAKQKQTALELQAVVEQSGVLSPWGLV